MVTPLRLIPLVCVQVAPGATHITFPVPLKLIFKLVTFPVIHRVSLPFILKFEPPDGEVYVQETGHCASTTVECIKEAKTKIEIE